MVRSVIFTAPVGRCDFLPDEWVIFFNTAQFFIV
jgi:hypothetical protein